MSTAKRAIRNLLVFKGDWGYCQPCMSPVWDTGLITHTLLEAEGRDDNSDVKRGLDWLVDRQITEAPGDWMDKRPNLRPGGWAFEYRNDHYPDVDDTAMVAMAIDRLGAPEHRESVERAAEWIIGMQSANGGWGSFDVDNTHYYLNTIPFADHGALLDPPTADVTGRCLVILDEIGRGTATYDGLSIAWATLEHLHQQNGCRALFATHYHELTRLSDKLDRVENATIAVKEHDGDVIFLHEVRKGAADRSYGVQVAKLAGLPNTVVERARVVLDALEKGEREGGGKREAFIDDLPLFSVAPTSPTPSKARNSLVEDRLKTVLPDELSPKEALDLIYELKDLSDDH
ncbi:MAG: hypothetical protein AAFW87_13020, partial [Pseudomonadota bacterium]